MVETTLAIAGASTLAVASVYAYVGYRLFAASPRAGPPSRAMKAFSFWWLSTSANQLMASALYLLAAFGYTDVAVQVTYVFLQRLLLALSLVGLMFYLVYLQTGRERIIPIAIVYAAYLAVGLYVLSVRTPVAVESYQWRTDIVWAGTLSPAWELINLLIVVPPIVGALMMMRVYRRIETPTRRFRVAMIGVGFTVWWLVAVAAGQPALYDIGWLQAVNRLVGITIAVGILLAYEPLPWMRRRYNLEPFSAQG